MGRSLSPVLLQELEDLDKDDDSTKSAMEALKLYVKDLDSKAIPMFLAQVSETKQTSLSSGEHTISLYEVLARVHGPKIAPQIDNIMSTIVKSLPLSAGAFALHQACSKAVSAIARYAIDPTTSEERKRHVIHCLCKPLSDCLLDSVEGLSCGAALCLEALVMLDNWQFASSEMVNEVCQRVAGALEKHSEINLHMALVMVLAKYNALIVEAYARLLIQSGLRVLDAGYVEEDSQKRVSAIHMVGSLLRYLDPKSVYSELELVIYEMEKCQSDRTPSVSRAASEALQIAKTICSDRLSKWETNVSLATKSRFSRRENTRMRKACSCEPLTASPESHTVDSFAGYDDLIQSPITMNHGYHSLDYSRKGPNRGLWRCEDEVVDVSHNDGVFSDIARGNTIISEYDEIYHNHGYYFENLAGFVQESAENKARKSKTPSPQNTNSHIDVDVNLFATPRKLIRSLQDLDNLDVGLSEKQLRRSRSPISMSMHRHNGPFRGMNCDDNRGRLVSGDDRLHASSEYVSSSKVMSNLDHIDKPQEKKHDNSAKQLACALFVALFAAFLFLLVIGDQDDHYVIIPT